MSFNLYDSNWIVLESHSNGNYRKYTNSYKGWTIIELKKKLRKKNLKTTIGWKWKHNMPKSKRPNKDSPKKKVYSNNQLRQNPWVIAK